MHPNGTQTLTFIVINFIHHPLTTYKTKTLTLMSLIVNLHHLNLHLHIWNKPHKKYFFVLIQEQQEFRKKQEQVMSTLAKALGHSASLRSCHKQEIIVDECVGLSEKCGVKEELQNQEEDVKSQYEAQKEINDEWVGIDQDDSVIQDFLSNLGNSSYDLHGPPLLDLEVDVDVWTSHNLQFFT